MRGLVQRVSRASVVIAGETVGEIDAGILLLLGVQRGDSEEQARRLLDKVLAYRIFADGEGRMNRSLSETGGGLLIVSQFTLAADTQKGLRPSFSSAETPARALELYDYFLQSARACHAKVAAGRFGAEMQVSLVNDGPVTFLLDV